MIIHIFSHFCLSHPFLSFLSFSLFLFSLSFFFSLFLLLKPHAKMYIRSNYMQLKPFMVKTCDKNMNQICSYRSNHC